MENHFGTELKKIRQELGLTQLQFAHQLDSMPWLISRYERGKNKPNLKFIEKLINTFRIEATRLFSISETKPEENP